MAEPTVPSASPAAPSSFRPEVGLGFNKLCEIEDFAHPELLPLIYDTHPHDAKRYGAAFPLATQYRKWWEVAMSVRAMRRFGALRQDAEILGVGAGVEVTAFYLTRHVARVFATDLYLDPGTWERDARPGMLAAAEPFSPFPFEPRRLVVQHMNGCVLHHPDASFDGIFSSSSIEHFGDRDAISAAAFEMGRVLKPGGVLTLATEYLIDGPPGAAGWDGVFLFSRADLLRTIVEASGLHLIDPLETRVSPSTLATCQELESSVQELLTQGLVRPHLALAFRGQTFGSVHLALRKGDPYPASDNSWARPSQALRARVARQAREVGCRLRGVPQPAEASLTF